MWTDWHQRPIKHKLIWITMLSSCSALLFASAAFVLYDMATYRDTLINDLHIRLKILEINTAAPLAFHDQAAAHEDLAPLRADPRLVSAALYDRNGVLFAEYRRGGEVVVPPISPDQETIRVGGGYVDLSLPVRLDGEAIGQITLRADLSDQQARLHSLLFIGGGVLLASLAVAFLMATRLQQTISGPVLALTAAARRVSQHKDYTIQVPQRGGDEIGQLAEGFNAMLAQIHEHEQELRQHRDTLEQDVIARTADLVQANDTLRQSESRYRHLVDHANDIICRMDLRGRFTYVNPSASQVTPFSSEALIGKRYLCVVSPAHRAEVVQFYRRAVRERGVLAAYDVPILAKEGQLAWVSVHVQALWEDGQCVGYQAIARNVTERRHMEEAMQRAHDKLEQLVAERTAELRQTIDRLSREITEREQTEAALHATQEQIRQMQKMEAIGQLAGGIAHDFNNLLTAIMGNAEIAVSKTSVENPTWQHLQRILDAGHRASDVVQQILTFTRQQDVSRTVMSLAPIVMDALTLLRATLPAGVELGHTADPDTPSVLANTTQLHQVLMNLCTNAWHALGEEQGRITVALSAVTLDKSLQSLLGTVPPGRYARLSVSDTGCGMDAETICRIFDPFFTTKPVGQGTGLGLSVVHGIMHSHEGAIVVESAPGEGTTFHLYFPAVETPASNNDPMARVPVPASAETADNGWSRSPHLVYIDDEEMLVELVQTLFEPLGYRVTGCTNPSEAMAIIEANPDAVDVVVTDYNMPDMSGLDVARAVNRLKPTLPVVLVSGFMTPVEQASGDESPVRAIVYKPTMLQELGAVLARVLPPSV